MQKSSVIRFFFMTLGLISFLLGVVGIFLPLLPTTPFILLALFCFSRSSERLKNWLLKSKILRQFWENYNTKCGVPLRTKVIAITFLWSGLILSSFLKYEYWYWGMLLAIGIGVTIHISSLRVPLK